MLAKTRWKVCKSLSTICNKNFNTTWIVDKANGYEQIQKQSPWIWLYKNDGHSVIRHFTQFCDIIYHMTFQLVKHLIFMLITPKYTLHHVSYSFPWPLFTSTSFRGANPNSKIQSKTNPHGFQNMRVLGHDSSECL